MTIMCRHCGMEQEATKVHGPGHRCGSPRVGWWNRCNHCRHLYPALPPASVRTRQNQRLYEKRSKQLLLGGASS